METGGAFKDSSGSPQVKWLGLEWRSRLNEFNHSRTSLGIFSYNTGNKLDIVLQIYFNQNYPLIHDELSRY
jgi:hypothetical protein